MAKGRAPIGDAPQFGKWSGPSVDPLRADVERGELLLHAVLARKVTRADRYEDDAGLLQAMRNPRGPAPVAIGEEQLVRLRRLGPHLVEHRSEALDLALVPGGLELGQDRREMHFGVRRRGRVLGRSRSGKLAEHVELELEAFEAAHRLADMFCSLAKDGVGALPDDMTVLLVVRKEAEPANGPTGWIRKPGAGAGAGGAPRSGTSVSRISSCERLNAVLTSSLTQALFPSSA